MVDCCLAGDVFTLWAVRGPQARYSLVDFDYMSYSAMRWAECRRRKEEFLSQARAVFSGQ